MTAVSLELGDVPGANSSLRESWDLLPDGNDNELLYWLEFFADLLVARDRAADAARVWGCVARHREERGLERPDSKRYLRTLDAARCGTTRRSTAPGTRAGRVPSTKRGDLRATSTTGCTTRGQKADIEGRPPGVVRRCSIGEAGER